MLKIYWTIIAVIIAIVIIVPTYLNKQFKGSKDICNNKGGIYVREYSGYICIEAKEIK